MAIFPDNILDALQIRLGLLNEVTICHKRALNYSDANGACGISVEEWQPLEYEIGSKWNFEPTLAQYSFNIQHLVKNAVQIDGEVAHRTAARSIRLMLVRDDTTAVALRALVDTSLRTERTQRYFVAGQRYASNLIDGSFVYLSATEFVVQTETT